MTRPTICRRVLVAAASLVAAAAAGRPALALGPDEVALVVNSNEPAGTGLAEFYAQQRHVPGNRILALDLPKGDEISAHEYAINVVPQVRKFLASGGLESKVKCLVPVYGVPLRIGARVNSPADSAELRAARAELVKLSDRIRPAVDAVEALARRLDPAFLPATGVALTELDRRWVAAAQAVSAQLPTIPDPKHRAEVLRQFYVAATPLMGAAYKIKAEQIDLALHADRQAAEMPGVQAEAAAYQKAGAEAAGYESVPEDPTTRGHLRGLVQADFGLLQYARLLHDQTDYLDDTHGGEAFDSELSLVRWKVHPFNHPTGGGVDRLFTNPLYYPVAANPHAATLMVTRLDAPTPDLVKAMIATSVRVEAKGLRGKIVIDSLGAPPGQDPPGHAGYGQYDNTLTDLDQILTARPGLDVLFDAKPELLPAHSASDVALYCGWYNVNAYVPCCSFAGGAVAMHVASYTMTTLHDPAHANWAAGLLNDGAVATIGPVQEPYLFAFPKADEFFPLLMTGKMTLAECYWRTEAVAAWQMTCVGDPLYNPYKTDPALTVADLPLRLRALFRGPGESPTTQP